MRIVLGTKLSRAPVIKALEKVQGIDLVALDDVSDVAPVAKDADALIISDPRGVDGANIAAALREPGCKVRWVQLISAGFEGLMAHGVPEGVVVTNQGGAVSPAVAEHGMTLILSMARRMDAIYANSERGEWSKDFTPPQMSVEGRTLAIVGYGNIGRQLARKAKAFDMVVVGLSRSAAEDTYADEMHPMTALHDVLARADVVALCIASTGATRHTMDHAAFAAMKKGAMFINITRGETVDQVALREALVSGHLRSAAIDVTDPEPLPAGDPLWSAPNIVISPHVAGAGGTGTAGRIASVIVENVERFKAGRPLIHLIKP